MEKEQRRVQRHGEALQQNHTIEKRSFFRLFDVPGTYFKPEVLQDLAAAQNAIDLNAGNELPAGYTYFGQFVSHDLTKVKRSDDIPSSEPVPTHELIQERTPSLDLDCLYGVGLQDPDAVYEPNGEFYSENTKDRTGSTAIDDLEIIDVPRRKGHRGTLARIPDSRNDENFIVSRLHVLFMNAHNKLLRRHIKKCGANPKTFENARRELTLIYQLIIKNDYLTRIIPDEMHGLLEPEPFILLGGHKQKVATLTTVATGSEPRIPLEFTGAAFRFGHSIVLGSYLLAKADERPTSLNRLFRLTGMGGLEGGSTNAHVNLDWSMFFALDDGRASAQRAQGISTKLQSAMQELLNEMPGNKDLTLRNLLRGNELGLPDAQTCMRYLWDQRPEYEYLEKELIGCAQFPEKTFLDEKRNDQPDQAELDHIKKLKSWQLDTQTPLWTYILMEPALLKNYKYKRLGILGSSIVAEVFRSLLISSRTALYNPDSYPEYFCELGCSQDDNRQDESESSAEANNTAEQKDALSPKSDRCSEEADETAIYDQTYSIKELYKLACSQE